MRILFYKENEMSPTIGGISRINCSLRDSLVRRGHTCFFLSSSFNERIIPDKSQSWLPDMQDEYCKTNINWLHDFLLDNKIDVIINNCFRSSSANLLDAARDGLKCKLITWIHNNIVEYGSLIGYRKEFLFRRRHLTLIYKILTSCILIKILRYLSKYKHRSTACECFYKSDNVVTVCHGNIEEFLFLIGCRDINNKVIAIPNFVNIVLGHNEKRSNNKRVVWCGTIDYNLKKTNWMIDIWRIVYPLHPDWSLVIIGDSRYLERIKQYAQIMKVKNVTFTGRVAPSTYYKTASIICSTSISESFGLTLVEGMKLGLVPIAFSSSAAIREIVGENGILVKPYDIEKYASELAELMNNNSRRENLSNLSRKAAMLYDEENVIRRWECLLMNN